MHETECTGCVRRPRRLPRSTQDLQRQERQKGKFCEGQNKGTLRMRLLRAQTKQTISFSPFPFVPMKNAEQHLPKPTQHTIRLASARSLVKPRKMPVARHHHVCSSNLSEKKTASSFFIFFELAISIFEKNMELAMMEPEPALMAGWQRRCDSRATRHGANHP